MEHRTPDDERLGALMRAVQAGDSVAYLTLLREIVPRVRQFITRSWNGAAPVDAEDLLQDVLLSVHVARASYDSSRPFLPWLLAIARHRIADGARRHARSTAREVKVENLDVTFSDLSTNFPMEPSADLGALREAVRSLPPKQRHAIELLKLQELSLKEAAAATGMSVGALKVTTHRALAALRRRLVPGNPDGH